MENKDSSLFDKEPKVLVTTMILLFIALTSFSATLVGLSRLYWEAMKLSWTWGGLF